MTATTGGTAPPATADGRAFWREVLLAGGSTTVPRWTREPVLGVAEHAVAVPADVTAAVRGLADELEVPLRAVLLAAHARVLAALAGAPEVTAGVVVAAGGRPLPCRLSTAAGSWRALVREAAHAEAALRTHGRFRLDDLRGELGVPGPSYETVLDPAGAGALVEDVIVRVGVTDRGDVLALRVRYRTDVLDSGGAARLAGYHVAALARMAADPDGGHAGASLLSAEELRFQREELAGRHRELPDLRVHELIQQRAAASPDAVAAVDGDRRWTYAELNARANRLGRALLAHGLRREDVVAVVTGRDLDRLAAVLAVLKAGGVYLPVDPRLPADRIARTLRRAGCRLVVTGAGSAGPLDRAVAELPDLQRLAVDGAGRHEGSDLGVPVAAGQLAHVSLASRSTGEPGGALCEHQGLLNQVLATIDDLGIGEGQVVASTAPHGLSASLGQLLAALVAGGTTLLVAGEAVPDAERSLDMVVAGRVAVLQVTPAFLEDVLAALERRPRPLPDLRCVSVTGEALERELARRWFATVPGVPLVHAYELTETSDETNHEVLHRAPDGERVPLGRPIANVRVSVVDEFLAPVPLGAPGEIVVSGVCVGRGYVGDPARTAAAFPPDPQRPGQRLCRSGDLGRWRPDGKLELLARAGVPTT
ncbi:AMP-binding protein [Geodermatophilus ruber]|uniref:Amino acid adenylation domain-containing protein n=1 Tax=Geodermatophilus ruber TaxID=504800 RepID=A0A1I4HVI1_9ACTN|nr:AMP-binding protein [Geodermatophilus ruber]SFL45787.1 amino acid adenylation domain-containing protein [Geodermatophilus ruber]